MWRYGCGAVLCAALIGGLATPALADHGQAGEPGPAPVGGFSVGDGLEAMIDERAGSLRFQVAIGGLSASWDSRRAGENRSGLGAGWGWTIGSVDTEGGVRVFPASGGVYEADASVTSGLPGYGVGDVRFEQREGVLPAREGVVEARPYSYVLTELGGVTTYFSATGDALAQSGLTDQRIDWLWSSAPAHRLVGVVDARGVRTDLVWGDAANSLVVRPAVNAGGTQAHEWRVQLAPGGVASVTDPLGQVTSYGYAGAGLVTSITGASGAATSVAWHQADDGIARIDELTTTDPAGTVLSSRTWQTSGTTVPTGWPATAQPGGAEFETVLADGASQVVSSYSAAGLLSHRELHVSTPAGDEVVQAVDYTYPDTKGVDPAELPGNWSRPSATEITHLDASGASRTIAEASVSDEAGRVVERTAADGSVTRTEYDPTPVGEAGVPSGLVLREIVETPDGLVRERVNELNEAHTAVVGTEVREAQAGREAAVVERTEFEVDDDGFVREQRVYPQGEASVAPVVTRWTEQVALAAGTVTHSETVAAGTAAEATTSQVSSLMHGAALEEFDALGNRAKTTMTASVGSPDAGALAEADGGAAAGPSIAEAASLTASIEFDAFGRSTGKTLTDGRETRVGYTRVLDEHGRTIEETDQSGAWTRHGYTVDGLTAWSETSAGQRTEVEYDPVTRVPVWERVTSPTGADVARVFGYDEVTGRPAWVADAADPERTRIEYEDDAFGNVTKVTYPDGREVRSEFDEHGRKTAVVDVAGNRTELSYTDAGVLASAVQTDVVGDELARVAYSYDELGRVRLGVDGGSYMFDAANRPVVHTAADGTVTETEYWADGSRRLQRIAGETTTFHWDDDTLVNETVEGGEGAGAASYLIGATRHARTVLQGDAEPVTSYFGTDRHGNVTTLTDRDGVVTARYAYSDYGTTTRTPVGEDHGERGVARNPFQYAGEHTDRSGTQHLATRSYDDGTMRFISMDQAPLENRFAFGDLNPIMRVDPTGQTSGRDTLNWIVAAVGLTLAVASAIGAYFALPGTLTALSVGAFAADVVAAGAATANVVDANFSDFMDDDTANWLMVAEIALPIGAALGGYVLGRMWKPRRVTYKLNAEDVDWEGAGVADHSSTRDTPDLIDTSNTSPLGKPSASSGTPAPSSLLSGAASQADQELFIRWQTLKRQMQTLTGKTDLALNVEETKGLIASIEGSELFQRVSGLVPGRQPIRRVAGYNPQLYELSQLEARVTHGEFQNIRYMNERLVDESRLKMLELNGKSYSLSSQL